MGKQIIIFDLDDTLTTGNFLGIANEIFDDNKKMEELTEYYIEDNFKITEEQREKYLDELVTRDVYENAKLIDGAYDTLKKLSKDFEIFIASASILKYREKYSGNFFSTRYNFIINSFDFINPYNIILTGDKSVIAGEYMVDDKLENLVSNKNVKHKILFTAYHNKNISTSELEKNNVIRVDNYAELYEFITTH